MLIVIVMDGSHLIKIGNLAKKCLKYMCGTLKLKGKVVGRKDCSLPSSCKGLLKPQIF